MSSGGTTQEQPEGMTRRQILELTGGAAAVGVAGSGAATVQETKENVESKLEDTTLIDVHTHITPIDAGIALIKSLRAPFSADAAID